jgi:hypothetical protein
MWVIRGWSDWLLTRQTLTMYEMHAALASLGIVYAVGFIVFSTW